MTQKVQVILVDDLDGSEATETVQFGLDGSAYEIDLNASHAAAFREALARFTTAARKVGRTGRPASGGRKAASGPADNAEIRTWARDKGETVNDRGRLPAALVDRYRATHGG